MRRILIDGRRAQGSRAGVGHYTKSVVSNWPEPSEAIVLTDERRAPETFGGMRQHSLKGGPVWNLRAAALAVRSGALFFSPEGYIVPGILGARALLTVHDLTSLEHPEMQTRRNVLVTRYLLGWALRRAGGILVPTEAVRADVLRRFPHVAHKLRVVHEGVRELAEHAPEAEKVVAPLEPYILYVGTVEPRKNVLALADAFLAAAPDDWNLVIVGQIGWLSDADRARFELLASEERVHHLGYVPDGWLGPAFAHARFFAYVSESEGFGLPVAEAMAAGVPVIHSDDPALVEVGGGAGIVVRRTHLADDLRSAIGRATAMDAGERATLVAAGLEASRRFDWALAARATRDALLELG